MDSLQNKTVWITGASSGIGKASAHLFNSKGAYTILSSRYLDALEEVKAGLKYPENAFLLPIDLEQYEDAQKWVSLAIKWKGSVDILLSNAGLGQFSRSLETSLSTERRIFDINYHGNVALSKALLPSFIENDSGQIVVIGSIAGKFGQAKLATYSASKAAVILYYESLRQELKNTNIRIQVVSPGFVNTSVTLNSLDKDGKPLNKNSPAQENGMPTDVFAKKLLKAMKSNRFHSYIGGKELLALPFHALLPTFFYSILTK